MKKLISLMLILALAISLVACGADTTPETTEAPETTAAPDTTAAPQENTGSAVTHFSMNSGEYYLTAFDNGDGTTYVEMATAERKIGYLEGDIFAKITEAVNAANLAALNGTEIYEEGDAVSSMYVEFADGTCYSANIYGVANADFDAAFAAMDACFAELTAELEVYVPQMMVEGEVDADALAAVQDIMNNSGVQGLDTMFVTGIPMDEYFGGTAGLSSTDGIVNGTKCGAMMMTTAFSLVVVTVEDESKIDAVRADFANTMDWRAWVCVAPSNAVIAQKGNMVLCMMGGDELYSLVAASIEANGWTNVETFQNPDLQ